MTMSERKVITRTQFEYARLAAAGLRRKEIARRMQVTAGAVDRMVTRACLRLLVDRRGLARALADCEVRNDPGGRRGCLKRGDPVLVTGGKYAGRGGAYDSSINSRQVYVRIGSAVLAIQRGHVRELQQSSTTNGATTHANTKQVQS